MAPTLNIAPLVTLPVGLDKLRSEAAEEGFDFMDRLAAEWRSDANRFAGRGEILLGVFHTAHLVAVGGLNRDPYANYDQVGRLRHLYVRKSARRTGVGSALVHQLLSHAKGNFKSVRLRTETLEAAAFYVELGFLAVEDQTATHVIRIGT